MSMGLLVSRQPACCPEPYAVLQFLCLQKPKPVQGRIRIVSELEVETKDDVLKVILDNTVCSRPAWPYSLSKTNLNTRNLWFPL